MRFTHTLGAVGLAVLVGVACVPVRSAVDGGPSIDAVVTTPTWSSIHATILQPSCALTDCHDARAQGAVDFTSAAVGYASTVDVIGAAPSCGRLVTPGHPEQSLLYTNTDPAGSGGCWNPMPLGLDPLPSAQRDVIRQWIALGAADD
jgi:hypothetical protein